MKWDKQDRKFWDVGEEKPLSLSEKPMANVMRAIVQCDGKIHDVHCMYKETNGPKLRFENRYTEVALRISLPVGAENDFTQLSKQTLTPAAVISC